MINKNSTIAILSAGCKFPKACNLKEFDSLLSNGVCAIQTISDSRWGDTEKIQWAGIVDEIYSFDPAFFNLSETEAKTVDPQHRIYYESVWQAMENAYLTKEELDGKNVGIFTGISTSDYALHMSKKENISRYSCIGSAGSIASNRLSYFMNWKGPSMAIDTACSSSLVAIHMACQSLRNNECDLAVAGGTNALLRQEVTDIFELSGMMSPEGKCKTFDASANGYVRGEGAGAVILKRLDDAIKDGDPVLAVIRGSMVNQDGFTNGLTAPNVKSQEELIREACNDAQITPDQLGYIELHGTGTLLGDCVEANALHKALSKEIEKGDIKCPVGSVKTNIGHLEAAAGVAAFIKTVLSVQKRRLYPSLNFSTPNKHISYDQLPIRVQTRLEAWDSEQRYAGVSGFGFGGTNCHIVLSNHFEKETDHRRKVSLDHYMLNLSANSEMSLSALRSSYKTLLSNVSPEEAQSICNLTNAGRSHFKHRLSIHGNNAGELLENLQEGTLHYFSGEAAKRKKLNIVFLFTGQGSQYYGMGKELYETQPAFREKFNWCAAQLLPHMDTPLLDLLFNKQADINNTAYAQPAIVSIQLSLVALLESLNVHPDLVVGHSLGELTAASIAGAFSAEQALKFAAKRGKLMSGAGGSGSMMEVTSTEESIRKIMAGHPVEIAGINGPEKILLSGSASAIDEVGKELKEQEIHFKKLVVSGAFHSALMESILPELGVFADELSNHPLSVKMLSTTTGRLLNKGQKIYADHWGSNVRNPVLFYTCSRQFKQLKMTHALEIGPNPILSNLAQQAEENTELIFLPTLCKGRNSKLSFFNAIAQLFTDGFDIQWPAEDRSTGTEIQLPNYPFDRKELKLELNKYPERETVGQASIEEAVVENSTPFINGEEDIVKKVQEIIGDLLMVAPSSINPDDSFIEMGADSILLISAIRKIESEFKLKLQVRQFFTDLNNIENLAAYLNRQSPVAQNIPKNSSEKKGRNETPLINDDDLSVQDIINRQLDIMQQQINLLNGKKGTAKVDAVQKQTAQVPPTSGDGKVSNTLPSWGIKSRASDVSGKQEIHLNALIKRYTEKTKKSKEFTKKYRKHLADNRASAGFRFSTKDMLYPIASNKASGACIWDLDGNKYVDISMGFGVHLFGHSPSFVDNALHAQVDQFIGLGPQSSLSGETAELICEITGHDRAMFCNSGTEAVMTALRLARTKRNRDQVVMFKNSYHGHFDGTLGEQSVKNPMEIEPMTPGTTQGTIDDLMVLNYDDESSLDYILELADEIAAVIVEPVQSRRPGVQPKEFLQALRKITEETGVLLIFDEMITGFRIHQAGAQHWFGVKADLATYGKIVGGGLPIGIVAGKADYMDTVDGGQWNYGDQSFPEAETTFFAGTFCKHPLTLAASKAVLEQIKKTGDDIYTDLNNKTTVLAERLNTFFEQVDAPFKVNHFGSLFRFEFQGNQDIFFYHLLEKGIYIWEGRNCFLSTAHTEEDIEYIYKAVTDSILELGKGGLLELNVNEIKEIPTNEAQKQLWRLAQVSPVGNSAYNICSAIDIKGDFDIDAFSRALNQVVLRHDALRSYFDAKGDQQIVVPEVSFQLNVVDATDNQKELMEAEIKAPFDLCQGPLFRAVIFKQKDGYRFLLNVHHAIADGLSIQLLFGELFKLYQGRNDLIQPAQLQYWSNWQTNIQTTSKYEEEKEFWNRQIQGAEPVRWLEEKSTVQPRSYKGGRYSTEFDPSLTEKVNAFSKENNVTPFMTLLGAYGALIERKISNSGFFIGVPSTGRNFDEEEQLIAYCAHLLPVRFNAKTMESSFRSSVHVLRDTFFDTFDNTIYPYSEIVKTWRGQNGGDNTPLVSITFNLDKIEDTIAVPGLDISPVTLPAYYSKFDLSLNVTDYKGILSASIDFNTDLFDEQTVKSLLDQFLILLSNGIDAPEKKTKTLDLFPDELVKTIETNFSNSAHTFEGPDTFLEQFEAQVKRVPNQDAIISRTMKLSYLELDQLSTSVADKLLQEGVSEKARIGLLLPRSFEMMTGILAALKIGGSFVPIEHQPAERVSKILKLAQCTALLSLEGFIPESVLTAFTGTVVIDEFNLEKENTVTDFTVAGSSPSDPAYVLFTSGSTGEPKAVEVSNFALNNYIHAATKAMELPSDSQYGLISSFGADLGYTTVFTSLANGSCLHILDQELTLDSYKLQEYLEQTPLDCLKIVPSHLKALMNVKSPERVLPRQRLILGGESCDVKFAERIKALVPECRVFNHYGPTETTIGVLVGEYTSTEQPGTLLLDTVLANNRIHLLNEQLEPVQICEAGTVYISGANLSNGYLNNDELNKKLFVSNGEGEKMYPTGDLACLTPNGKLQWLGRSDHQVKIRGYRVELAEIERMIETHPSVAQAAVIVKAASPVAYVKVKTTKFDQDTVISFLKQKLPEYMVPYQWMAVNEFPIKPNGKLDRSALPEIEDQKQDIREEISPVAKQIQAIWQSVLNIKHISLHDQFFEIGGDSIHSIQIASRIREAGLYCSPGDLYKYSTIHALVKKISTAGLEIPKATIEGMVSLTPVQQRFLEYFDETPDHWNMSLLLNIGNQITPQMAKEAFTLLMLHHDQLRARFTKKADRWEQHINPEPAFAFNEIDLIGESVQLVEGYCIEEQAKVILRDSLIRLTWINTGGSPQLFITLHHMLVDAVSLRILLSDFNILLNSQKTGEEPKLAAKSVSYKEWSGAMKQFAESVSILDEVEYWQELNNIPKPDWPLPMDASGTNTVGQEKVYVTQLSANETQQLIGHTANTDKYDMRSVLLTALAKAISKAEDESLLYVELEGHGRENSFMTKDVTRTVGWFTSHYPAFLATDETDKSKAVQDIHEQLSYMPVGGLSYGAMRYISGKIEGRELPDVSFNYLGQFNKDELEGSNFSVQQTKCAEERSKASKRLYKLCVEAIIREDVLEIEWIYSSRQHDAEIIHKVADSFMKFLADFTTNTLGQGESPDMSAITLESNDLSDVLNLLSD